MFSVLILISVQSVSLKLKKSDNYKSLAYTFNNDDKQTKMAIVCISLTNKSQTIAHNSLHTLVTKARLTKKDKEKNFFAVRRLPAEMKLKPFLFLFVTSLYYSVIVKFD